MDEDETHEFTLTDEERDIDAQLTDEERPVFRRALVRMVRDGRGHAFKKCDHHPACAVRALRADMVRDQHGRLWSLTDPDIPDGTVLTPIAPNARTA